MARRECECTPQSGHYQDLIFIFPATMKLHYCWCDTILAPFQEVDFLLHVILLTPETPEISTRVTGHLMVR